MMGDPLQASNAWSMGNLGLSTVLGDDANASSYDVDDTGGQVRVGWLARMRWRLFRWALAAGALVAFVNHWPGGSH